MNIPIILLSITFAILPSGLLALEKNIPACLKHENSPVFKELYVLKIENKADGSIEVTFDKGKTWVNLGSVILPAARVDDKGFAAVALSRPGCIAASAVNAIHINASTREGGRTVFSILPKEFFKRDKKPGSYFQCNSSIYTDVPAGEMIFGGGFSPFVGNQVLLVKSSKVYSLTNGYIPQMDDVFLVMVQRPQHFPKEIMFENKIGGVVKIRYFSGGEKVIAKVIKPVLGIGRFEGTEYADIGRIRANHPGVVCVSTSPAGKIGGFQIIPWEHAKEMDYVLQRSQWLVIDANEGGGCSLEGMAPFFRYFIRPNYSSLDLEDENWYNKLLSRYLVQVKYADDDKWHPLPGKEIDKYYLKRKLPNWAKRTIEDVRQIRILFPIDNPEEKEEG